MSSWFGVALVLVAVVLLVVDLKAIGHGLPAIAGVAALVLGVLVLLSPTALYLWTALVVTLVAVATLAGVLLVAGFGGAFSNRPATTGAEGMIGEVGVVKEPVGGELEGWVFVHGEWWRAVVAVAPEDAHKRDEQDHGQLIKTGRRVQVVGLRDGRVVVLPHEEPVALERSIGS